MVNWVIKLEGSLNLVLIIIRVARIGPMKLMGEIIHGEGQTTGLQVIWGIFLQDSWDIIYEWVDESGQIISFSIVDLSVWSV